MMAPMNNPKAAKHTYIKPMGKMSLPSMTLTDV